MILKIAKKKKQKQNTPTRAAKTTARKRKEACQDEGLKNPERTSREINQGWLDAYKKTKVIQRVKIIHSKACFSKSQETRICGGMDRISLRKMIQCHGDMGLPEGCREQLM